MENLQRLEVNLDFDYEPKQHRVAVKLEDFVKESTKALDQALRQGKELHIPGGDKWSVGTHPEVGPYKIDHVSLHTGVFDITHSEQFICKSLKNAFMPIGTGSTEREALESFIYNQTLGTEKRVSGDFTL